MIFILIKDNCNLDLFLFLKKNSFIQWIINLDFSVNPLLVVVNDPFFMNLTLFYRPGKEFSTSIPRSKESDSILCF